MLSAQGGDLVGAWMVVLGSALGWVSISQSRPSPSWSSDFATPVCRLISRPFGLEDQRPTLKGSPFGIRAREGDEGLFALASSEISVSLSGSS